MFYYLSWTLRQMHQLANAMQEICFTIIIGLYSHTVLNLPYDSKIGIRDFHISISPRVVNLGGFTVKHLHLAICRDFNIFASTKFCVSKIFILFTNVRLSIHITPKSLHKMKYLAKFVKWNTSRNEVVLQSSQSKLNILLLGEFQRLTTVIVRQDTFYETSYNFYNSDINFYSHTHIKTVPRSI